MTTGHVLMGLLAQGDRHGYDLKRAHDDQFPRARPLAFGQVYATLERLEKRGHAVPAQVERVDGPDRVVYHLTDEGREELHRWLDEIEPPSPFESNPLAIKATLALLVADTSTARSFLQRQRASHLDAMRRHTAVKTDPAASLTEILAADHAIAHLDADLRWLDTALERITALAKEIRP
ncbi:MAG: PadR family transcriptional regulator [Ilumatobacteraceae bacterium]